MRNDQIRSQLSSLADRWNGASLDGGLLMLAIDGDDFNVCCTGNRPLISSALAAIACVNPAVEDVLLRTGELLLRRKRLLHDRPVIDDKEGGGS